MPRAKKQHLKKRKDGRYACRYKDQWFYSLDEDEALTFQAKWKNSSNRHSTSSPLSDRLSYTYFTIPAGRVLLPRRCPARYPSASSTSVFWLSKRSAQGCTTDSSIRTGAYTSASSSSRRRRMETCPAIPATTYASCVRMTKPS